MGNIKDLIGARLTDVENNVDGFTVLYFTAENGDIFAIDLAPTIRNLSVKGLKETAPEVSVQEQLVECGSCYKDNGYLAKKFV